MGLFAMGTPKLKNINLPSVGNVKKVSEYKDVLESYKNGIVNLQKKLDGYDKRAMENQLAIVQTALDLTYLKEQNEKVLELLENSDISQKEEMKTQITSLIETMAEMNYKLENMDRNIVNQISNLLMETQKLTIYQYKQNQIELSGRLDRTEKSLKGNKVLLWFLFIFQFIGMGGIAFLILYLLEIITF
jgi:hypothetical protein